MKKAHVSTLLATALTLSAVTVSAEEIKLPNPDLSSPVLKLIDQRRSTRAYSDKKISKELLANLLWAAFGSNSHGTRTIPTARNEQKMKVFVIFDNAVWQYDGLKQQLIRFSDNNLMPDLARQPFVEQAPVHIIYAGEKQFAEAHSGSAYQNVALYATEKGLASVVRGAFDHDAVHKKLGLSDDEIVTYHQVIGYPED